ncbi:MAG: RDD family protein [Chloroflexi bacterium]|nr:RDD family protein [Chloroflexota bacterium]
MKSSTSLRYAGFVKRMVAFALDYLVIAVYVVALAVTTLGIFRVLEFAGRAVTFPQNPVIGDLIAFFTLVLPTILYFTLQESSARQATWGKRKIGIRVVNANGETLTRKQAFVRSLVKFLPWQIAHTCLFQIEGLPFAPAQPAPLVLIGFAIVYGLVGMYALSTVISKNRRAPYDWAAGSYVILNSHSPK